MKQTGPLSEFQTFADNLGFRLSDEQAAALETYESLLLERGEPLGLIATGDLARLRERHLLDCLRAVPEVGGATRAYDLGSGAGLPGLVIAIASPDLRVTLVERKQRRAGFLELAIRELGLTNADVAAEGTEGVSTPVDVCFARAFAPLPSAWDTARGLLVSGGNLIYFAGLGSGESGEPPMLEGSSENRTSACLLLESAGPLVIITKE